MKLTYTNENIAKPIELPFGALPYGILFEIKTDENIRIWKRVTYRKCELTPKRRNCYPFTTGLLKDPDSIKSFLEDDVICRLIHQSQIRKVSQSIIES